MSTTLNRVIELVVNGDLPGGYNALLKSKTSGEAISRRPRLMAGDRFSLRLYFRKPNTAIGAAASVYELESPNSMVLVGKADPDAITGSSLFSIVDWVKIGSGDAAYYQGVCDLTSAEIAALFASGPDEVNISADLEVRDAINSARVTYRLELTLCRQVYDGVGILPTTLSASYLQSPDGSTWQLTVNDAGQMSIIKVGLAQRDPDFIITQQAIFVTPGGYYWAMSIDDNGQLQKELIQ